MTYFTTGFYRHNTGERWAVGKPNPYARWVFLRSNANRIADPKDRTSLMAAADRKLADVNADISDLTVDLGPEGQSVHAFLTNRDPNRVHELITKLPASVREQVAALDLSRRDLSSLEAHLSSCTGAMIR